MSEATSARNRAGLTLEDAACQVRVCVSYLRRVERSGDCSYPLAMRLARLYRCSANVFLYTNKGSETPTTSKSLKDPIKATNKEKPLAFEAKGRKQGGVLLIGFATITI